MKFDETKLLIRELDQERYAPAAETAAALRDFWVSQPLLYDPKWGEHDLRNGGTALDVYQDLVTPAACLRFKLAFIVTGESFRRSRA